MRDTDSRGQVYFLSKKQKLFSTKLSIICFINASCTVSTVVGIEHILETIQLIKCIQRPKRERFSIYGLRFYVSIHEVSNYLQAASRC